MVLPSSRSRTSSLNPIDAPARRNYGEHATGAPPARFAQHDSGLLPFWLLRVKSGHHVSLQVTPVRSAPVKSSPAK